MEELIDKLRDLNRKTKKGYHVSVYASGDIFLKNDGDFIFFATDMQSLREEMYRMILEVN
jgi:hypothetical protein